MKHPLAAAAIAAALGFAGVAAHAQPPPLIVVEDRGGVSALPYYEALDVPPPAGAARPVEVPHPPTRRFGEADMLPVHSYRLTPGEVQPRTIQAPGLAPLFLVGDDDRSRAWLDERASRLRERHATGLVVNVETAEALAALRRLAPGLVLSPVSGDDLADRLGLRHYPVLVTATGIEQ